MFLHLSVSQEWYAPSLAEQHIFFTRTMNRIFLHNLREVVYITAIWLFVTLLYLYIKFYDIPETVLSSIYAVKGPISKDWIYGVAMKMAISLGLILALLHTFVYPRFSRFKNFVFRLTAKAIIFLLLSILTFWIMSYLYRGQSLKSISDGLELSGRSFVINIFVYMFLTENLLAIFLLLRRSLGAKYFVNMIMDTYLHPKEEERVFMSEPVLMLSQSLTGGSAVTYFIPKFLAISNSFFQSFTVLPPTR